MKECRLGEDVPELGGGKRDSGGMDPEYGVSTHNLYIPVFKVKGVVASSYLFTGVFDIFAELRRGQVGYRGDT